MERFKQLASMVWEILTAAVEGYSRDHASHLSAATAFYALFAVAPLILIATAIGGLVWGQEAARAELLGQIDILLGPEARAYIAELLENWRDPSAGWLATLLGSVTTLYLAFRVFDALRDILDTLWGVRVRPDVSWGDTFRNYLRSFAIMFLVGPLFVASTLLSEVLTRLDDVMKDLLGLELGFDFWVYIALSLVLLTVMFALIYKWLPDVKIHWRDVWFGASVTAVLFSVGRALIGWYLTYATTASLFGAAGSLVVLLFWTYYSAQILFFGAEITQVYATTRGQGIEPSPIAVRLELVDDPTPTERLDV